MYSRSAKQDYDVDFYLAGERVPSGVYRHIESGREIILEKEDYLPASLDGRVACYRRIQSMWSQWGQRAA